MTNIFDEIDPSGRYLDFVRKFYRYSKYKGKVPENNILYIYGNKCSGKTTLFNCAGVPFGKKVCITGYDWLIRMKGCIPALNLVKLCDHDDRSYDFLKLVGGAKEFPHIGFIIESNMHPDDNICENAIIVHAPNKFMSAPFDYSKRTEEVKNAICGSSQLMD
jgi:hypothetical protein